MELQDYLTVARKRWLSIALVTALMIGLAAVATAVRTPMYQARSQVFVSVRTTGGTTSDLVQGSSFTQRQVKSYTDLVTSPRVLGPVVESLGLPTTPEALAGSITASNPLDTVLINITASAEDPQVAADVANATAESLAVQVTELEKPSDAAASPVEINTVRTATAPGAPYSPSRRLNLALGLLVGLALGIGLAVLRELLDTKVRSASDVERVTDTSVIGTIGFDDDAPEHPLIVQTSPHSHRAEAFRRLRTNLQFLDIADRPQSIVVTSAMPGEGKTTTSINLAISLADAGRHVVLVDGDLRRPSIAEYMGLEGSVGLTTVLIGKADADDVVQPWGNGYLHVLASGEVPPNPSELLGSRSMANLLEHLTKVYDVVLIDTAPLLPVTDAAILARLTGGALIVVGADKLHRQQLADAMSSLETVGARRLGVVLNRVLRRQSEGYTYYDYTSEHESAGGSAGGPAARVSGALGRVQRPSARRRRHRPPEAGTAAPTHERGSGAERGGGQQPATRTVDEIVSSEPATRSSYWPGEPLDGPPDVRL
ncbi:polysaccharide biosynthesis tyrosine autokinase [Pengzhenrongella sicca]|uniref:non-specific protein-tyrosine kinase n=1 Tax=Pengzhenrongella sicca TaxID=2819238 RepID=A0A8A4ZEV7_9MICO|nr:polysaccharide biosynthesis tyrosine autokinase [Pengzhenrongella sicca]QTE29027.1 polysaccharide biosynthesis tyrosine autokinase [Pengzhenrongella sicca]